MNDACIGWHDPDGCPVHGGEYHGCCLRHTRSADTRRHRCECGAVIQGLRGVPGPHSDAVEMHDSAASYRRHRRRGETACDECKRAHATAARIRREQRRLRETA